MANRILVPLDGSALAESVVPFVSVLAKGLGAEVVLLNVAEHLPQYGPDTGPHATLDQRLARYQEQATTYLGGIAHQLATNGVAVKCDTAVGDPGEQIVRYAEHEGVIMIAMATHGRSGVLRWVYGSVAEGVAQQSERPVLLVRPAGLESQQDRVVRKVVVPLDGTNAAEGALPLAEAIARVLNVPISLVRVVDRAAIPDEVDLVRHGAVSDSLGGAGYAFNEMIPAGVPEQEVVVAEREYAAGYLEAKANILRGIGFAADSAVVTGSPAAEIIAAGQPGSLIVMAAHSRDGSVGVQLGSTARRVIQNAEAPVLFVRPK